MADKNGASGAAFVRAVAAGTRGLAEVRIDRAAELLQKGEGLRVASQVPGDLNADTLAAFIPQMFERVVQGVAPWCSPVWMSCL